MSRETNELLGHAADNDGIDEYDNPLPRWWVGMFVISVIWAVVYGVDYHFISQHSQAAAFDAEMLAASERWPAKEVASSELGPADIEAGKAIYATNCVACHGADLTGGIGPNLIDAEWVHGGELDQIRATVTNGVPEKGMLAWGGILGDAKVAQVSAYVFSQSAK